MLAEASPVAEYTAYGVILLLVVGLATKGVPAVATWFKGWMDGVLGQMKSTLDSVLADSKENRETFERTIKEYRHERDNRENALVLKVEEAQRAHITALQHLREKP